MVRSPDRRGDPRVRPIGANQPVGVLRVVARDGSVHRGHVHERERARGAPFVQVVPLDPVGCLLIPKPRGQASRRQRPELRDAKLVGSPGVREPSYLFESGEELRAAEGGWRTGTELIPRLHEEWPHLAEERELGWAWRVEVTRPVTRAGWHGTGPHVVEVIAPR